MEPVQLVEAYLASASTRGATPWSRLGFGSQPSELRGETVWRLELEGKGEDAGLLSGSLRLRFDLDALAASLVVFEPTGFDAALGAGELVALLNSRRPLGCWYLDDTGRVCMRHALTFGTTELSEPLVHDLLVATMLEAELWRNAFQLVCVAQMPAARALEMMDRV